MQLKGRKDDDDGQRVKIPFNNMKILGDNPEVLRKDVRVTSVSLVTRICTRAQQVFIGQGLGLVGRVSSPSEAKGKAQSPGTQ